jgi:flagellar hook-length control protein FliK
MIDFIFTAGLIDQLDSTESSRENPRSMEDLGGSGTDFWKIFEGLLGRTGLIFAENQAADNENSPSGLEMTESTDDVDHQLFPLSIGLQREEAGIESEASSRSELRLSFADDKSIEDVNQFIRLNTLSDQALGDPARANENSEEGIWIELPDKSPHFSKEQILQIGNPVESPHSSKEKIRAIGNPVKFSRSKEQVLPTGSPADSPQFSKDQVLQLGGSDSIYTRFKDLASAYFLDNDRQSQNPLQSLKRPNLPHVPSFLIAESDRVLGEQIEPVEFARRFDLSANRDPDSSEEVQTPAKPEKGNQIRAAKSVDLVNSILTMSNSKAKGASPRHTVLANHVQETGDQEVPKGDGEKLLVGSDAASRPVSRKSNSVQKAPVSKSGTLEFEESSEMAARKQSPENPSPKQAPPAPLKRLVFVPAKAMEGIKESHSVNVRPVDSNQVDLKSIEPRLEFLHARPHSTSPNGDETAKLNVMAGGDDKSHQEVKPTGSPKGEPTAANTIMARPAEAEGADSAPTTTSRMGLAGMSERVDSRERGESRQQQKANRAQSSFSHKIMGLGAEKADNSGAKPSLNPYPASAFGEGAEQVERIEQAAPNSQKGQWQVLDRNAGISLVTQKPVVVENSPLIPVEYKESRYRLQGETLRNAVDQIVQSARLKISEGRQEIQVKLKPEFLGMVKIVVESTEQEIKAVMFVERPELRQALEGQFPQLQRSLQEQAIRLDRLDIRDFSAQMNSGGGSNEQGMRRAVGGQNSHLSQLNMGVDASVVSARDGQITNREFGYNTLELIA